MLSRSFLFNRIKLDFLTHLLMSSKCMLIMQKIYSHTQYQNLFYFSNSNNLIRNVWQVYLMSLTGDNKDQKNVGGWDKTNIWCWLKQQHLIISCPIFYFLLWHILLLLFSFALLLLSPLCACCVPWRKIFLFDSHFWSSLISCSDSWKFYMNYIQISYNLNIFQIHLEFLRNF